LQLLLSLPFTPSTYHVLLAKAAVGARTRRTARSGRLINAIRGFTIRLLAIGPFRDDEEFPAVVPKSQVAARGRTKRVLNDEIFNSVVIEVKFVLVVLADLDVRRRVHDLGLRRLRQCQRAHSRCSCRECIRVEVLMD
jgi:hypothetical protein